jgi:hypothetical protein
VFEELGTGFTLLAFDGGDGSGRTFERSAAALGVPLKVIRDTFDGGREAYGARLILVRPDQYVAWTGVAPPDDVDGLIRKTVGRD